MLNRNILREELEKVAFDTQLNLAELILGKTGYYGGIGSALAGHLIDPYKKKMKEINARGAKNITRQDLEELEKARKKSLKNQLIGTFGGAGIAGTASSIASKRILEESLKSMNLQGKTPLISALVSSGLVAAAPIMGVSGIATAIRNSKRKKQLKELRKQLEQE